jgi:leucyl aminopeptidase
MNFTLVGGDSARARGDLLVIPIFDGELNDRKKQAAALLSADKKLKGMLLKLAAQEGFKAKSEQTLVVHTHGKLGSQRVALVGLGLRSKLTMEAIRLAVGRAVKLANRHHLKSCVVALPVLRELEEAIQAIVEGFELGAYRFEKWRTTNKDEKSAPRVGQVALVLPEGIKKSPALTEAVKLGK